MKKTKTTKIYYIQNIYCVLIYLQISKKSYYCKLIEAKNHRLTVIQVL